MTLGEKKTKVLMMCQNFFPLSTASAQRASAFAKTLASSSFRVVALTKSPIHFESDTMTVIGQRVKREIPIMDPVRSFVYVLKAMLVSRKDRPDVVVSTVPDVTNAIAGFIVSKLFRVPHIIDIRDYWESTFLMHPFNRIIPKTLSFLLIKGVSFVYRQASSLITINETLKAILTARGVPSDWVSLIPNGADTSLFRPCQDEECIKDLREKFGLPRSRLIFVYGGSLMQDFRFDIVLRAINLLGRTSPSADFLLFIIGRPTKVSGANKILEMIQESELQDKVKMIGPVSLGRMAELLRCCDVGIIPEDGDELFKCSITTKIFGYLASGLSVLASGPEDGELDKFLVRHKVGLFIGSPTPKKFAEGIKRFIQNKSETKKLGLEGRKVACEYYDRFKLAHRIISIINQNVKRKDFSVRATDSS